MPRLVRPHIPVEVQCRVAMKGLGEIWPDQVIRDWKPASLTSLRDLLKTKLAEVLRCKFDELRLDHDPALGVRKKVFRKGVHVDYVPMANDPEHLFYRPHGPQHAGSHDVKTRIRGDRGQFSDVTLIKRERRRERKRDRRPRSGKAVPTFKAAVRKPRKTKWPKRPLRGSGRWPKPKEKKR